ncbi:MAG: response regulator transcription factor [Coriobacteriales bacterium]|jgi:DNA-binding response OmpR family regulator|nr:response regulator transcription factor [Coriobacteriales bacterium]
MLHSPQILIVEDDADISALLVTLLSGSGFDTTTAYSGSEALLVLERERFDLILLDLMLPGKSGLEVLRELRSGACTTPVIMLTAVTSKDSIVELLSAGANDYLTKPFDTRELLARVNVQLRITQAAAAPKKGGDHDAPQGAAGEREGHELLRHKNLVCDGDAFDAFLNGHPARLSKTEFAVLQLLMSAPTRVFTKDSLYESVWGGEFLGDDNTINVHISKLRSKLAKLDRDTEYITTVWGIGFRMSE